MKVRQFDLVRNPAAEPDAPPFLLVLQSDLLAGLESVIAAPVWPISARPGWQARLHPRHSIRGQTYAVAVPDLASIPLAELGPRIESWADLRGELVSAIDLLISGY